MICWTRSLKSESDQKRRDLGDQENTGEGPRVAARPAQQGCPADNDRGDSLEEIGLADARVRAAAEIPRAGCRRSPRRRNSRRKPPPKRPSPGTSASRAARSLAPVAKRKRPGTDNCSTATTRIDSEKPHEDDRRERDWAGARRRARRLEQVIRNGADRSPLRVNEDPTQDHEARGQA